MTGEPAAQHARVLRNGDEVFVTFTDNRSAIYPYRKSWPVKKYVDKALAELEIIAAPSMNYSYDMRRK